MNPAPAISIETPSPRDRSRGLGLSMRTAARHGFRGIMRLPARALLAAVWLYQRTVSPALIVLFPTCGCRFSPTCSHYAAEAIRQHGAFAGLALAVVRLLKCTPLHPGGHDPVPTTLRTRPVCRRSPAHSV